MISNDDIVARIKKACEVKPGIDWGNCAWEVRQMMKEARREEREKVVGEVKKWVKENNFIVDETFQAIRYEFLIAFLDTLSKPTLEEQTCSVSKGSIALIPKEDGSIKCSRCGKSFASYFISGGTHSRGKTNQTGVARRDMA